MCVLSASQNKEENRAISFYDQDAELQLHCQIRKRESAYFAVGTGC